VCVHVRLTKSSVLGNGPSQAHNPGSLGSSRNKVLKIGGIAALEILSVVEGSLPYNSPVFQWRAVSKVETGASASEASVTGSARTLKKAGCYTSLDPSLVVDLGEDLDADLVPDASRTPLEEPWVFT